MTKPKPSRAAGRAKAAAMPPTPQPAPAQPKGWRLETPPLPEGQTPDRFMAQVASDGIVGSARSLVDFGKATFGELSLTDCAMVLKGTAKGYNDGDLSAAVTMLSSQAVALNAMFGELARRSALNMGEYIEASERYMRLALKAQGQCRATLETLAAIKNPPVVFARQANIAHGPQQVNNGTAPPLSEQHAHAAKTKTQSSELLEAPDGERMDTRPASASNGAHPHLETVGAVNRPANG